MNHVCLWPESRQENTTIRGPMLHPEQNVASAPLPTHKHLSNRHLLTATKKASQSNDIEYLSSGSLVVDGEYGYHCSIRPMNQKAWVDVGSPRFSYLQPVQYICNYYYLCLYIIPKFFIPPMCHPASTPLFSSVEA